ncbi:MAG: OmpH family outer membrane protein [Flammeovirgaceae bacterium]|jgi:outer membrane protein|nr:OmpH family outer membrane protein [Flammeovirgaceae bacterium]
MKKMSLILCAILIHINIAYSEIKVGVVKVDQILKEAPQTIVSNKKLEKEFKAKTDKLKKSIATMQAKEDDYKKNSITMADAEKEKQAKELQTLRIDLQRDERELREDIDLRRREEINSLQGKVNIAIEELAKKDKYDLILYSGVAYASENVDITNAVIKALGTVK